MKLVHFHPSQSNRREEFDDLVARRYVLLYANVTSYFRCRLKTLSMKRCDYYRGRLMARLGAKSKATKQTQGYIRRYKEPILGIASQCE